MIFHEKEISMQIENIIIAVPIEEELLKPLYAWGKRFDWSHVKTAHFIHVVKKNITPLEFGLMELPDDSTYQGMVPTLNKFLQEEAKKIVPPDFTGKVLFHLTAEFNPTEQIISYTKQLKAQLLVVSTRGKHGFQGLFHSSFTDHMVRFAPCDVYVVRPQ